MILRVDRDTGHLSELPLVRNLRPRRVHPESWRLRAWLALSEDGAATINTPAIDVMTCFMGAHFVTKAWSRRTRRSLPRRHEIRKNCGR